MTNNHILDNCLKLDNKFTLWFHNPNDTNWAIDSYHQILTFSTVEEFWVLSKSLSSSLIEKCMFFLMKEGIEPIWEDPENLNGCCISFKIDKADCYSVWEDLTIHLITNSLNGKINGASVSPKKLFNITKIWTGELVETEDYKTPRSSKLHGKPSIVNANSSNIQKDKEKINYYKQQK